ncbi:Aste57867_24058 [Aphanomyces stellatus]|uniref:Aste57867_24058 protein n=1 Tax=Aphanomyces stellatus TaxID=120398 RepID=A0A485LR02_9STRA|nr:hypothetical protein As57867_023985 [Aphanomyces stellatus]VFU00701.1 Aste57867_24058 [Aphanomyces stellatus]
MEDRDTDALVYSAATVNTLKRKASSIASEDDKENLDDSGFLFSHSPSTNPLKRKAESHEMPRAKGVDISSPSRARGPTNNQLDSPRKPPHGGLHHTFLLNNFQHVPSLDFGTVAIGQSSTMTVVLSNPSEFGVANVLVEDILPKAAASCFFVDSHQTLVIPMQSSTSLSVTFTPHAAGRTTGKLYIRLNKRFRLFCALQGTSPASTLTKAASLGAASTSSSLLRASSSSVKSTASSSASTIKRPKLAKQPSIPQTSSDQEWKKRRVVYDAHWIPKQEAGFQKWLNFTLLGAHFSEIQDETPLTQDRYYHLRQLAITRLESKIRAAALSTYHHAQTDHILYRLNSEITACRLTIRVDRPLHVDVGLQQDLMDLFNSYHPLWLTLALEVVLGIKLVDSLSDLIKASSSTRLPQFLRRTIVERIVQDPAFKLKHGPSYEATLAQLRVATLVRCLMIVYFLDQAHLTRHVDHIALPCLFRPSSTIKRSKQMLIELCQRFLAHEGNVLRHLCHLEFEVHYKQSVLEEMDMQVTNLALDLRDGMRLVRLLETLDAGCHGLSQQLRLPAISRLQKVHNVQVALTCLQERYHMPLNTLESSGITRQVTGIGAKDIVDGHREKTLALLWQGSSLLHMISYFKLSHVVKIPQLELEILRIQRRRHRGAWPDDESPNYSVDKTKEPIAWLLLEWCRVVCAQYNVPIRNFTASFADGKALCLMVHYYHPRLLEKWEIQWTTSDTTNAQIASVTPLLANERANFALVNQKVKQLGQVPVLLPLFDSEQLPEEKCILTFLAYLHSRLLGASREIHAAFCLQHWWLPRFRRSRTKKRDHSARVLQQFWASTSISRWVQRSIRHRVMHIVKIQSFGRLVLAKQERHRRHAAVAVLQHAVRTWLQSLRKAQNQFQRAIAQPIVAATTIQTFWRASRRRKQTHALWSALIFHTKRVRHAAAVVLQRWVHRHHVQSFWYAMVYYLRLQKQQHMAAATLQAWWKRVSGPQTAHLWLAWGLAARNPAVGAVRRLQQWWRTVCENRRVKSVQDTWHDHIHNVLRRQAAVDTLEAWWRRHVITSSWRRVVARAVESQRQTLWDQVKHASAARIQQWWRRGVHLHAVQDWWLQLAGLVWEQDVAARTIQGAWRRHRRDTTLHDAAVRVQGWVRESQRMWRVRETWTQLAYGLWDLDTRETAATMVQRLWRRVCIRRRWYDVVHQAKTRHADEEGRARDAATRLQRWWTSATQLAALKQKWTQWTMALWDLRNQEVAATMVQRWWRAVQQERRRRVADQNMQVKAATCIQVWWLKALRMWQVKQQWTELAMALWEQETRAVAATMIQRWWQRAKQAQIELLTQQLEDHASRRLQRWWRHVEQGRRVAEWWEAVVAALREVRRAAATQVQTWVVACLANRRARRVQRQWTALALQLEQQKAMQLQVEEEAKRVQAAMEEAKRVQVEMENAKREQERMEEARRVQAAMEEAKRMELEMEKAKREQERMEEARRVQAAMEEAKRIEEAMTKRLQEAEAKKAKVLAMEKRAVAGRRIARWAATCVENRRAASVQQLWTALVQSIQDDEAASMQMWDAAATTIQQCVRRYQQLQWWRGVVAHTQNQHAAALYIQAWWRDQKSTPHKNDDKPQTIRRIWTVDPAVVLQRWWRGWFCRNDGLLMGDGVCLGMRVRLGCVEAVTIMRHRVQAAQTSADVATLALRQQSAVYVQEHNVPLRYRLKRALAILNTSPRLHDMMQAVHTLETCTRLSKECCTECVAHHVPRLLFRAIRKCNRSRPHLELLHQLLQVCVNLKANDDVDGIAASVELWIDLMQMHRDSTTLFMLSARLCKRALLFLKVRDLLPDEAPRRLRLLHALLAKKTQTKSVVDRVTGTAASKEHLHPKRAASALQSLLECVDK